MNCCKCVSIGKAGIQANLIDESGNIPATVYINRDMYSTQYAFNQITEIGQIFSIRVIGVMFELNDPHVHIIGEVYQGLKN